MRCVFAGALVSSGARAGIEMFSDNLNDLNYVNCRPRQCTWRSIGEWEWGMPEN